MLEWLPGSLREALVRLPPEWTVRAEEIRVRCGRPLEIVAAQDFTYVAPRGRPTRTAAEALHPTKEDCLKLADSVTNRSVYTLEEQLRRGYITIPGGHRIGLAGRAALEGGRIRTLQQFAGFNIRIAREVKGCARSIMPLLWNSDISAPHHTLIVSPPQRGKTTMLRDIARLISSGGWAGGAAPDRARKVGIVDERSEIAAVFEGVPTFDVGPRTDVLDACPKAEGMMLMIRALSPEVLIVDELGRPEDAEAVLEASRAGIAVIATAHGFDLDDCKGRPSLAPLFAERTFGRIVTLAPRGPTGEVADVRDADGRRLAVPVRPAGAAGLRR